MRELYLTDHKIGLGWRKIGKQEKIKAVYNAMVRKYGARVADAMNNLRPYVGMPEGAVREFIYVDGHGNEFYAYGFARVVGAYKLYLPTTYFQVFRAAGSVSAPSAIYMLNGKVSEVKW